MRPTSIKSDSNFAQRKCTLVMRAMKKAKGCFVATVENTEGGGEFGIFAVSDSRHGISGIRINSSENEFWLILMLHGEFRASRKSPRDGSSCWQRRNRNIET